MNNIYVVDDVIRKSFKKLGKSNSYLTLILYCIYIKRNSRSTNKKILGLWFIKHPNFYEIKNEFTI